LKLQFDEPPSNFAFKFNLRRYTAVLIWAVLDTLTSSWQYEEQFLALDGKALHPLTSELNLRTFGNTLLTLELNLSTLGTHQRINLGYIGDKVSLS